MQLSTFIFLHLDIDFRSTGIFWYWIFYIPASKDDLVPPVPVLTRYKKEAAIKVFVKKELFESKLPDERRSINIDVPATAKLCVQLNTLHVTSRHSFSVKAPNYKFCYYLYCFHMLFTVCSQSTKQVRRQHMGAMDS